MEEAVVKQVAGDAVIRQLLVAASLRTLVQKRQACKAAGMGLGLGPDNDFLLRQAVRDAVCATFADRRVLEALLALRKLHGGAAPAAEPVSAAPSPAGAVTAVSRAATSSPAATCGPEAATAACTPQQSVVAQQQEQEEQVRPQLGPHLSQEQPFAPPGAGAAAAATQEASRQSQDIGQQPCQPAQLRLLPQPQQHQDDAGEPHASNTTADTACQTGLRQEAPGSSITSGIGDMAPQLAASEPPTVAAAAAMSVLQRAEQPPPPVPPQQVVHTAPVTDTQRQCDGGSGGGGVAEAMAPKTTELPQLPQQPPPLPQQHQVGDIPLAQPADKPSQRAGDMPPPPPSPASRRARDATAESYASDDFNSDTDSAGSATAATPPPRPPPPAAAAAAADAPGAHTPRRSVHFSAALVSSIHHTPGVLSCAELQDMFYTASELDAFLAEADGEASAGDDGSCAEQQQGAQQQRGAQQQQGAQQQWVAQQGRQQRSGGAVFSLDFEQEFGRGRGEVDEEEFSLQGSNSSDAF